MAPLYTQTANVMTSYALATARYLNYSLAETNNAALIEVRLCMPSKGTPPSTRKRSAQETGGSQRTR